MRFSRKKQKAFNRVSSLTLLVGLFLTSAMPALGVKLPSVSSVAAQLEKRYHLNLGSIQNQGEVFNVADDKKTTPEVKIFFSPSDPRPGEKMTAKALPMYFSNAEGDLYYTWYLRRALCDLTNSPSAAVKAACDRDGNGKVTVEDWKIEAATYLVQNGFDNSATSYASDSDNDGYKAKYGGDNKANTPDYCYVHDNTSGTNYELANSASSISFGCPSGTSPACMAEEEEVTPGALSSGTGDTFVSANTGACHMAGYPACSSGVPVCDTGSPRCVVSPTSTTSCGSVLAGCSTGTASTASLYCRHLFPDRSGYTTGDGSFGAGEENAWNTDPNDPSTAGNGNKDEANLVGLGQSDFVWNYDSGDKVGVAVEGTSMINTKHDDSSYMIMWAFSKNDCPISLASGMGSYTQNIRGYGVTIPTADLDINKCLERNLVDPTEGGQATNLGVDITVSPSSPINDETGDKSGDIVVAQASVNNAGRGVTDILFDWKVEISDNIQFSTSIGNVSDITSDMRSLGLLSNTKGNALDAIRLKMDIPSTFGGKSLSSYLNSGVGYLRFSSKVSENFSTGVVRKGRSDVIVKFVSTSKKITAYTADTRLVGTSMHVVLPPASGIICNSNPLERTACPVIRSEIVGLRIDPSGLSNFSWNINGKNFSCNQTDVSPDCVNGEQNEVNFFPVTGNVGDVYTVTVTANDVASGKIITLARAFHIVEPQVSIVSKDQTLAWPKLLGQYSDISGATGCTSGICDDYSRTIFQAYSGEGVMFKAEFLPSFLGTVAERQWTIDGTSVAESAPGEMGFLAAKPAGSVFNISLKALVSQPVDTRRALIDIWGVSQLDSPEIRFTTTDQLEVLDPTPLAGGAGGTRAFFAAVASYIPASVLFMFRILLSGVLILFTTSFLFALIPERVVERKHFS